MAFSDSSSCYLAIPASDDFASVRQTVKEAVEEFQIEPLEQTVSSAGGSVRTSARELLGRADFVIADEHNAAVAIGHFRSFRDELFGHATRILQ